MELVLRWPFVSQWDMSLRQLASTIAEAGRACDLHVGRTVQGLGEPLMSLSVAQFTTPNSKQIERLIVSNRLAHLPRQRGVQDKAPGTERRDRSPTASW